MKFIIKNDSTTRDMDKNRPFLFLTFFLLRINFNQKLSEKGTLRKSSPFFKARKSFKSFLDSFC
jgi:hypothetical protein